MQEPNTAKQISKQKVLNFFQGCQNNICLSKHCKNYPKTDQILQQLRQNKQEGLRYVLLNLKADSLQIDCAIPKTQNQLVNELSDYQELFDLDFQYILNLSIQNQEKKFNCLELLIDKIQNEIEINSKEKILKHLDKVLFKQFSQIKQVIQDKIKNFDIFICLIKLLLCFREFLTLENLSLFKNLKELLKSLHFSNIYDNSFDKIQQRTVSLNKQKTLQLIENLQNIITCTRCFKEEITDLTQEEQDLIDICFQVLQFFFYVNQLEFFHEKINIEEFQNDDILKKDEYRLEVIRTLMKAGKEKNINYPVQIQREISLKENFSFLNWPFYYSTAQKVDLLRFESKILQQFEMHSSFQNLIHNPLLLLQGGLFLELNLGRDTILEDTLSQLHSKGKSSNLKKTLKIKFKGEPGVDEGGLTKEFFQILIEKLFDPNFGMFETKNNDRFMWFNKNSFECSVNFELIGMLLGIALYNSTILKLNFPLVVYKKLKNVEISQDQKYVENNQSQFIEDEISLEDLKEFEPELYVSFSNLLKQDFSNQETGFNFQVTYMSWGEPIDYDLIENGGNIEVNEQNKQYFVEKYLQWYFVDSIKKQFEPFAIGFHKVLTGEIINKFNASDLFLSICGNDVLDFKELKRTTKYDDGYTEASKTIQYFWQIVIHELDENQKKNFLKFLTGSDRAPLRGLSDIKLVISRQGDGDQLPAAHTCFNHLLLPDYNNLNKLKEKLLKSIEHFEGFGLF